MWATSTSNPVPSTQTNPSGKGASPTELLIALDRSRPRELRAKLECGLRDAIQQGRLAVGTALPASRTLARELALARSVVVQAYGQLAAEGYLETRQGSGTRVRAGNGAQPPPRTTGERAAARAPASGEPCPIRRASTARGSGAAARRSG